LAEKIPCRGICLTPPKMLKVFQLSPVIKLITPKPAECYRHQRRTSARSAGLFLGLSLALRDPLRQITPALLLAPLAVAQAEEARRPNVIVIVADDLGYADLGSQGSTDVPSPNIDSIATHGVRFTDGYITAPQCCPSRAGLLTGRYQSRFGFDSNDSVRPLSASNPAGMGGMPVGERTMGDRFKASGYVTGMIGKWHVGGESGMRPYERGFDETFWHPIGGVLLPDPNTGFLKDIYRGAVQVQESEYSTDAFGREAVDFIGRHREQPFFLYVAFVPPHLPQEAKPEDLAKFAHVTDVKRRTMLAMMASLDENVGRVLDKLREENLEEDTLVFFVSDNGGTPHKNASRNLPCRGWKGQMLDGGIRVPFLVQWKGRLPAGEVYRQPVISLDILPTALAAAGVEPPPEWNLDGVNLLPYLTGKNQGAPHAALYWRFRASTDPEYYNRWAIRQGDWKLVKTHLEPLALYNLAVDISESNNLATAEPERVAAMQAAWEQWNEDNVEYYVLGGPVGTTIFNAGRNWSVATNWVGGIVPAFNNEADLIFNSPIGFPSMRTDANRTVRSMTFGANLPTNGSTTITLEPRNDPGSVFKITMEAASEDEAASANASIVIENGFGARLLRYGPNNGSTITLDLASDLDLRVNDPAASFGFNDAFSGAGAINKYGSGLATATRNNSSFRGGINIFQGTFATHANAAASGTGAITLGGDGSADAATWSVGSTVAFANPVVVTTGAGARTISLFATATGNPTLSGGMTLNKDVTFDVARYTTNTHDRITNAGTLTGPGGIIKTGSGLLALSGSNNYTGGTTVNAGTLNMAPSSSLRFVIGGHGTNNRVTVGSSASASFDGQFIFDLSAASTINGATWQIVNPSPGTTYGPNFLVQGFDGSGDIWTLATNGVTYQFEEATGMLSVSGGTPADRYATWLTNYPALSGSDALVSADPDGDNLANALEWILGGNPLVPDDGLRALRSTMTQAGMVITFTRADDSEEAAACYIAYSTDLATWSEVAIGPVSSGPTPDGVTVGVVENGAAPDDITVTLPASLAPQARLFARLKAVMP
jgi:autotransporter-associated beta strand protein